MPGEKKNVSHFYHVEDKNHLILSVPFLNAQSEVNLLFAISE